MANEIIMAEGQINWPASNIFSADAQTLPPSKTMALTDLEPPVGTRARLYPKLKSWRPGMPNVVLVEDMDSIRRELEYFVRQTAIEDATVTHYKSASRAWTFIQSHARDIDLIVTDYQLSERSMSGLDLVEKVRGQRLTKHIPIVMLTVTQDREFRRKAIAAGATAYFIKPMDKIMAPELFAGLMHQARAHRETFAELSGVLKSIGADIRPEELQAIVSQGACQLVPLADWQKILSMAKAMEALGGEMKGLSGIFNPKHKDLMPHVTLQKGEPV